MDRVQPRVVGGARISNQQGHDCTVALARAASLSVCSAS
jgi:hypothetical protein